MTPVAHCATGLAAGGVVLPFIKNFFKTSYFALIVIFFISALLPDIDGLSIAFNHKVYFGKKWYSHHMFTHSFIGALVLSFIIAVFYYFFATVIQGVRNLFRREKRLLENRGMRFLGAWLASFIGCIVHFLGDLPTPPGPWQGIALMWPSTAHYGGWSNIFWHNWYLIYASLVFIILFISVQIISAISTTTLSLVQNRYKQLVEYAIQGVSVLVCVIFIFKVVSFINEHDYKQYGYHKWNKLNLAKIPKKYAEKTPKLYKDFTIFWRKQGVGKNTISYLYKKGQDYFTAVHKKWAPFLSNFFPGTSASSDMKLYRKLQSLIPGMEDHQKGKFRVWMVREKFPDLDFYNKGILYARNHAIGKIFMQMSNAWMIIFRIDKRDAQGKAIKVSRVYHGNKIYIPDLIGPQININKFKPYKRYWAFWKHEGIPYNLIPGSGYSRYNNLIQGYYISLNKKPGVIWPGYQTGVLLHPGPYSGGCLVSCFCHFDISYHLMHQMYPLWQSADEIIKINIPGYIFRGKKRIWGKLMFIKDLDVKLKEALEKKKKSGYKTANL